MSEVANTPIQDQDTKLPKDVGFHRFMRKKESWKYYWLKAITILTVMVVAGIAFTSRYTIVGDPQEVRCIPGYTVYLVDRNDTTPIRDQLYVFHSKDLRPFYEEGTQMLKYLRAIPGDVVEVRDNDQIFINGNASEWGLGLARDKLSKPSSDFHGKTTLAQNQYWFLGTSTESFDSRYWGAVKGESIVGRAYPLF